MRTRWTLALLLLLPAQVRSGEGDVRLLTDDSIPRYLARGQELARAQEWDKMVDVLQRVIAGDREIFPDLPEEVLNSAVHTDDGRIYYPAREICLRELSKLPPEGLLVYRASYDVKARALLRKARGERSLDRRLGGYAEVYDKYLVSSAGDDALEEAGNLNLSLGRYYEALALYRRLVEVYPSDTDRDLAMVLAKAAYCAARIGDTEHRNVLLERLASEYPRARLRVEGKRVESGQLKDHPALAIRGHSAVEGRGWPMPGGNPARARLGDDLPEDLPLEPFWSFELSERDPRLEAAFGRWRVVMHHRQKAGVPSNNPHRFLSMPYPTVRPIVHDGIVYYKDSVELLARRVSSGSLVQLVARYGLDENREVDTDPTFRFPLSVVRPSMTGNTNSARSIEAAYRWLDYGGNTVVAEGDHLVTMEWDHAPTHLYGRGRPVRGKPNMLAVYHRTTGKTLWGWEKHGDYCSLAIRQDPDALREWQQDWQANPSTVFRGPGVVAGGLLYTVARAEDSHGGIALWAFDVAKGRVVFRTQLHYADEIYHDQPLPVGTSLAVAGGVVYIVTNSGVVAAVDALPPGRVRWIRRYTRKLRRQLQGRRFAPVVEQAYAYNDPVVSSGRVIVAAPDSEEVVSLDAETGRLVWRLTKKSLGTVAHIVGVSKGVLVMAGEEVTAVDVATGEIRWGPKPLNVFPSGRGFVGEKYAYVPTNIPHARASAIRRFEIHDARGKEAPAFRFKIEKLGNLLSVDGRLIIANDDRVMCFSTYAAERKRLDDRIAEGDTSALLFERGLLALHKDRRADARADFGRALALAAKEGRDPAKIRIRALDNLFALATKSRSLEPLEEARRIALAARRERDIHGRRRPYLAQIAFLEVEVLARSGRAQEAVDALEAFLDTHTDEQVVVEDRVRDAAGAARRLRAQLMSEPKFVNAFAASVRRKIDAAARKGDLEALEAIRVRYPGESPTEEVFFALARIHESAGDTARAEAALRSVIREFPGHPRLAEAHLRLARILAAKKLFLAARRQRDNGVALLDENGRVLNAALVAELDGLLTGEGKPGLLPRLSLPLTPSKTDFGGRVPVRLSGKVPRTLEGLVVLAGARGYRALDAAGKVLWNVKTPAGAAPEAGPPADPDTAAVASAVAAGRFARFAGGDLLIGDVYGMTRIDARTGEVRWRRPERAADAADAAQRAIRNVGSDLQQLRKDGDLHRRHRLPAYALAGATFVRVHPQYGVEGFNAATGAGVWRDAEVKGSTFGQLEVVGQLIAVGWPLAGHVRVYGVTDGRLVNSLETDGVLLAPPLLDALGRLYMVTGTDVRADSGALHILSVHNGTAAHPRTYQVHSPHAAVLHADGKRVVFHDGNSGGLNLHFIDLESGNAVAMAAEDLMRDFSVVRDGNRIFVLTSKRGLRGEGGRLFRIDLRTREVLRYERPPQALAYAAPLLTQRHIVVSGCDARGGHVRLYEREASKDKSPPREVFPIRGLGKLTSKLDFRTGPGGEPSYRTPPAIATAGKGLVVANPYGAYRLRGPDARQEEGG